MKERVSKLLSRLDRVKDFDPYNKKLMNDCRDVVQDLHDEVERLAWHNERLLQVIYQNQSELENINEPTGE